MSDSIAVTVAIPRDQLPQVPPPDYYSQRNCELLGLDERAFLELLRRPGAPKAARLGKLRLVPRAEIVRFIESIRSQIAGTTPIDGADEVLRKMGCTRRAG